MCRLRFAYGLMLAASAILLAPADATAQSLGIHEIRGGLLLHDMPDMWSGFGLEKRSLDINLEVAFPGVSFLGGTLRPVVGGTVSTRGDTSHAYLDARWGFELPFNVFIATGLGAAVHDGLIDPIAMDRKALGSRVLFHIPFEIGVMLDRRHSISFYFEHTSNAGLANTNEGLDRLGVRYGYRF